MACIDSWLPLQVCTFFSVCFLECLFSGLKVVSGHGLPPVGRSYGVVDWSRWDDTGGSRVIPVASVRRVRMFSWFSLPGMACAARGGRPPPLSVSCSLSLAVVVPLGQLLRLLLLIFSYSYFSYSYSSSRLHSALRFLYLLFSAARLLPSLRASSL